MPAESHLVAFRGRIHHLSSIIGLLQEDISTLLAIPESIVPQISREVRLGADEHSGGPSVWQASQDGTLHTRTTA